MRLGTLCCSVQPPSCRTGPHPNRGPREPSNIHADMGGATLSCGMWHCIHTTRWGHLCACPLLLRDGGTAS